MPTMPTPPFPGGLNTDCELHDDGQGLHVEIRWHAEAQPEYIPWMAGEAVSDALKRLIIQPGLDGKALADLREQVRMVRESTARRGKSAALAALVALERALAEDNDTVRELACEWCGVDACDVTPRGPFAAASNPGECTTPLIPV